jgi:hypothetical protein
MERIKKIQGTQSFETGGSMGYNCCFFLNFVPLHIESPYNFGGKNPLQRVNGHAENTV